MEVSKRKPFKLTKEEAKSSLRAQFWSDNQNIDKNTPFMKKLEEMCKGIDFSEEKSKTKEEVEKLRGKIE